jgi:hypothetical protein
VESLVNKGLRENCREWGTELINEEERICPKTLGRKEKGVRLKIPSVNSGVNAFGQPSNHSQPQVELTLSEASAK